MNKPKYEIVKLWTNNLLANRSHPNIRSCHKKIQNTQGGFVDQTILKSNLVRSFLS